jgi:signal transduction histidine kinase
MSPQLQTISDLIKNSSGISDAEKESLLKTIKEADKNQSMIQFKLERIEKDRNTLSVMLQESIEDLQKKSLVIEDANKALTQTLEELKATQAQLIQSEKMASLGELTAGIAHEIQNPLNFVNNFSEVSNELLDEMTEQLEKGNAKEAKAIAKEVKMSLEKINLHGKRADGIVKSMLQHSRTSNNKKEPTDINILADEYSRLAYHGLRAKDKSFNAAIKTDYDENIGLVKIISQDIGRVILNLITNAFYAVMEKKKLQPAGYEPTVTVSTKKIDSKIIVEVKDNGTGIPQKALDKIFQPSLPQSQQAREQGLVYH